MGVDVNQIWIETKSHLRFKSIHFIDWRMLETTPHNPLLPGWNLESGIFVCRDFAGKKVPKKVKMAKKMWRNLYSKITVGFCRLCTFVGTNTSCSYCGNLLKIVYVCFPFQKGEIILFLRVVLAEIPRPTTWDIWNLALPKWDFNYGSLNWFSRRIWKNHQRCINSFFGLASVALEVNRSIEKMVVQFGWW